MDQDNNSKNLKKSHQRKNSYRLDGYDYSSAGAYFVTICSAYRRKIFGKNSDGSFSINRYGEIVINEWFRSAIIHKNVLLFPDEFVLMPDHLHGIVWMIDSDCNENENENYDQQLIDRDKNRFLGNIVGQFKASTTRRINKIRKTPGIKIWQRNFFDRIIRNEFELDRIRKHIHQNPSVENWDQEQFFNWIDEEK